MCISSQGQDLYSHQKLNTYIYWFSSESGYRRRRRRQRRMPQYNHNGDIANETIRALTPALLCVVWHRLPAAAVCDDDIVERRSTRTGRTTIWRSSIPASSSPTCMLISVLVSFSPTSFVPSVSKDTALNYVIYSSTRVYCSSRVLLNSDNISDTYMYSLITSHILPTTLVIQMGARKTREWTTSECSSSCFPLSRDQTSHRPVLQDRNVRADWTDSAES